MERARTAGLARAVLERARRRRAPEAALGAGARRDPQDAGPGAGGAFGPQEEEAARLSAAFAAAAGLVQEAARQCRKYYSLVPACRCKEHEIRHICRYHSRQAGERGLEAAEEEKEPDIRHLKTWSDMCPPVSEEGKKNAASRVSSQPKTCPCCMRKPSKDIYIEVSPGTYSITATSEDMVKQTHVVDVSAGQSVDLTFVL